MNRRRFLSLFAGTAAASATAYFLPPIGGWHQSGLVCGHLWVPNYRQFEYDYSGRRWLYKGLVYSTDHNRLLTIPRWCAKGMLVVNMRSDVIDEQMKVRPREQWEQWEQWQHPDLSSVL